MANTRAEIRQAQRADEKAAVRYAPGAVVRKLERRDHNKYAPVNQEVNEETVDDPDSSEPGGTE